MASPYLRICANSPAPALLNPSSTHWPAVYHQQTCLCPSSHSEYSCYLLALKETWLFPDASTSSAVFPFMPKASVWPVFTSLPTSAFQPLLLSFLPRTQILWSPHHQTVLLPWYAHFPVLQNNHFTSPLSLSLLWIFPLPCLSTPPCLPYLMKLFSQAFQLHWKKM